MEHIDIMNGEQNELSTNLNEVATASISAAITAEIQAGYCLAKKYPRDMDLAKIIIMKECERVDIVWKTFIISLLEMAIF